MALELNNQPITTNEFVRIVISSVIEDLEINFDEYANLYISNYKEALSEDEKLKVAEWKTKIFNKLNQLMKTQDLEKYV